MILDRIENKNAYKEMPDLYAVLCALEKAGTTLPDSRIVLDGERLFINPVSMTTKPVEECLYEAHRKYADVHYILSGVECISTQDVTLLQTAVAFDAEKDVGFFCGQEANTVHLQPGWFLVCLPHDAHRVCMMETAPAPVDKLVGKILMSK